MDTKYGRVPPEHAFSPSSHIASGSSVSKCDSSNQHIIVLRTWSGQQGGPQSGQQGALLTSHNAYRQPDSHRSEQNLLSRSDSLQPAAWKPHSVANSYQKPGLDASVQLTGLNGNDGVILPKEYTKATSGLSRGRKVYRNGGSGKNTYPKTQTIPKVSPLHEQYQPLSRQFGLHQSQTSAYNQNPQPFPLQTGVNLAPVHIRGPEMQSRRLGPGQRFAPTRLHYIPQLFGGHNIKRLGDEQTLEQTTTTQRSKKPVTYPIKTYTFPPRHTQSYMPQRPVLHQKSKWLRIRSHQLTGAAGVFGQSF
ncbi:uncharacterized protein LOC129456667 [Periophthalmus magnuspinnatus]|uniref:uncharacterized protein LOC129456667 n=1 Tax=Periophthalmus magnuspinnatus TaxID=409849 RepID=UPI002436CCA9|nr:uncharacterized protein LOC129456667 [Periophthalmus magnuspinnatus]XP_055081415.1 uncharacterized protein LOC129456667 [Periophthalmus magnuspinnatus]